MMWEFYCGLVFKLLVMFYCSIFWFYGEAFSLPWAPCNPRSLVEPAFGNRNKAFKNDTWFPLVCEGISFH